MSEQAPSLDCRVVGSVDTLLDVAARLGQRLSHLAGHQVGDFLLLFGEEIAHAPENIATRRRRRSLPPLEPFGRRFHRSIDIVRA